MNKFGRFKVKKDWGQAGKQGDILGEDIFIEQYWTPVKFDHEEDPTFFKTSGIDKYEPTYKRCPDCGRTAFKLLMQYGEWQYKCSYQLCNFQGVI